MATGSGEAKIKVWDAPVRIFHWTFVVLILAAWFTGEWRGERFPYHAYIGYAAGIVLVFRIIWGFVGSSYARFSDFIYSPGKTFKYAFEVMKAAPSRYVGHNPLGGWMIMLMIVVIAVTVVTGIMGPVQHDMEEIHEFLGENIILILVALHILGVVADSIMTKENLARAMVTGEKPAALYEGEGRHFTGGGGTRSLVVLLVALVVGIGGAVAIDLKGIVDTEKNHQIEFFKQYQARKAAEEAAAKAAAEQPAPAEPETGE
jgi:cytochrome b